MAAPPKRPSKAAEILATMKGGRTNKAPWGNDLPSKPLKPKSYMLVMYDTKGKSGQGQIIEEVYATHEEASKAAVRLIRDGGQGFKDFEVVPEYD